MPVATFYNGSHGPLADGTSYRQRSAFVASRVYPLGTVLRLTTRSGRALTVTVRDRTAPGRTNLDLPGRCFSRLCGRGWRRKGVLRVTCRVISSPKKRGRR